MAPSVNRFVLCAAFVASIAVQAQRASADDLDAKNVILAGTRPGIVLVWKTNSAIDELSSKHVQGGQLYGAVVAHTEHILRARIPQSAGPDVATIRLVYFYDAMDTRYKIETVSGIDTLGAISAKSSDLVAHDSAWNAQLEAGRTPPGMINTVGHGWVQAISPR